MQDQRAMIDSKIEQVDQNLKLIEGHCSDVDKFLEQSELETEQKFQNTLNSIETLRKENIGMTAVLNDKDANLAKKLAAT